MEEKEALFEKTVKSGNKETSFTQYKDGDIVYSVSELEEAQLDRIEKKLDRLLELLGSKELSASYDWPKLPDHIAKQFGVGKYVRN